MRYVKLNDVLDALRKSKEVKVDYSLSSMASMAADAAEQQEYEFIRLLEKLDSVWIDKT